MGMGHLWLTWMGHLWLKWVGHLWLKWVGHLRLKWVGHLWFIWIGQLSFVFFFFRYAQNMPVFRGVPFLVLEWPWASVPLNSWPVAYYRKGGTTPHLSFALRSPTFGWHIVLWALTWLWIFKLLNKLGVGLNGWSYYNWGEPEQAPY